MDRGVHGTAQPITEHINVRLPQIHDFEAIKVSIELTHVVYISLTHDPSFRTTFQKESGLNIMAFVIDLLPNMIYGPIDSVI